MEYAVNFKLKISGKFIDGRGVFKFPVSTIQEFKSEVKKHLFLNGAKPADVLIKLANRPDGWE